MKMRITNDWLRKRIESEPEGMSCGAGAPARCETCNGDGAIEKPAPQRDDPEYASVVPCEACNGHGWV